jgi:hypothetical protein
MTPARAIFFDRATIHKHFDLETIRRHGGRLRFRLK